MRVLVLGTGVIGTIYGYVLAQAGHEVSHLVHRDRLLEGPSDLRLRLLDGRDQRAVDVDAVYRARLVDRFGPNDGFELVLVSVKHYDLPAALPLLAAGAGSADVLLFNNWWDSFATIEAQLAGRYLFGFPVAGGGLIDGVLDAALLDHVELAEVDGRQTPRLDRVAGLFESAGLGVERPERMRDWLWVHFATEAGLIASAIAAGGVDALLDSTDRLASAVLAVRDGLEVCRARGVDVDAMPDAQSFYAPEAMVAAGVQQFYASNLPARRILDRHAGVEELKRIYNDVVGTGTQLGVAMPHLLALRAAVDRWDGSVPNRRPEPAGVGVGRSSSSSC